MKPQLIILALISWSISLHVKAQDRDNPFQYFFRVRPVEMGITEEKPIWEFKPIVQIPAIKVTESTRENAQLDAPFLASTGGGITLQRRIVKNDKNYATFSWSPIMILLTGDTSKDDPLDLSFCTTVGFFNNLIQFGGGWDFGEVVGRSRGFLVISAGINITNN